MFTRFRHRADSVNNWLFKLRGGTSALINTGTVFAGVVIADHRANAIFNRAGGDWKAAYYFMAQTSIVGVVMALF